MAMNEAQSDPSMEEILASIRRIIAEDEPAPASEDVLDLAEPVADAPAPEPEVVMAAPSQQAPGGADELVFEDDVVADEDHYVTSAAPPAVEPVAAVPRAAPVAREEALLSEAVASATASALTRLASSMRIADDPNQTIEGMVRELLKPMLKEWLDANLPAIVDAKVEAALERVARLAR
jgi:cell pole-organizing protein PopZ